MFYRFLSRNLVDFCRRSLAFLVFLKCNVLDFLIIRCGLLLVPFDSLCFLSISRKCFALSRISSSVSVVLLSS